MSHFSYSYEFVEGISWYFGMSRGFFSMSHPWAMISHPWNRPMAIHGHPWHGDPQRGKQAKFRPSSDSPACGRWPPNWAMAWNAQVGWAVGWGSWIHNWAYLDWRHAGTVLSNVDYMDSYHVLIGMIRDVYPNNSMVWLYDYQYLNYKHSVYRGMVNCKSYFLMYDLKIPAKGLIRHN